MSEPDRDGFFLDDFLATPESGSRGKGTVGGGPGGGDFMVLKLSFREGADNGRSGCPGDREVIVLRLALRGGLSGGGLNGDDPSGGALKGGDTGGERRVSAAVEPSACGGLRGREAGVAIADGRAWWLMCLGGGAKKECRGLFVAVSPTISPVTFSWPFRVIGLGDSFAM